MKKLFVLIVTLAGFAILVPPVFAGGFASVTAVNGFSIHFGSSHHDQGFHFRHNHPGPYWRKYGHKGNRHGKKRHFNTHRKGHRYRARPYRHWRGYDRHFFGHSRFGWWSMKRVWNPGHYNKRGIWVSGKWILIPR